MKNTFIIMLLLSVYGVCYANTDSSKTNYFITGGIFANGNIYHSNFSDLPSYPNCCTKFESGFGIAPAVGLGFEYLFNEAFFKTNFRYSARLLYSNATAHFSVDEHIGNNLTGDSYTKIISNYRLEPTLRTIALENHLRIFPQSIDPLSFSAGLGIAFPISPKVYQIETIKSPKDINFAETGTKYRNERSGKLIESASALYSLLFGARYEAWQYKDVVIAPELQMSLGLNDVVSSRNWKYSNARLGVSFLYNIPRKEIEIIKPAMQPPMPTPSLPAHDVLDFRQIITYHNTEVRDSMELPIPITRTLFLAYTHYFPKIFFKRNSDEFYSSITPNTEYGQYIDSERSFATFLNDNVHDIEIVIGVTSDEEDGIYEKRKERIEELLRRSGVVKTSHISFRKELTDRSKMSEMMLEDNRYAKIIPFDKHPILMKDTREISSRLNSSDRNVIFFSAIIPENVELQEYKLEAEFNNQIIYTSTATEGRLNMIDKYYIDNMSAPIPLYIRSSIKDKDGRIASQERMVLIAPYVSNVKPIFNHNESGEEIFNLGLFDYNGTDFIITDRLVYENVTVSIQEWKRVVIMPYTDDIGGATYNKQLAEKRAMAAVKLLNLEEGQYRIEYNDSFLFENDTPFGRMMNRCVMIRLEDI